MVKKVEKKVEKKVSGKVSAVAYAKVVVINAIGKMQRDMDKLVSKYVAEVNAERKKSKNAPLTEKDVKGIKREAERLVNQIVNITVWD